MGYGTYHYCGPVILIKPVVKTIEIQIRSCPNPACSFHQHVLPVHQNFCSSCGALLTDDVESTEEITAAWHDFVYDKSEAYSMYEDVMLAPEFAPTFQGKQIVLVNDRTWAHDTDSDVVIDMLKQAEAPARWLKEFTSRHTAMIDDAAFFFGRDNVSLGVLEFYYSL